MITNQKGNNYFHLQARTKDGVIVSDFKFTDSGLPVPSI